MIISVKAEYALQAVFDLAAQPSGDLVKIAEIATRQKIPQKFLELILSDLKQGGFVESRRGAEGGYRLAKPADQIMVGDVLRFMEEGKQNKRAADGPFRQICGRASIAPSPPSSIAPTFAELAREWKQSQTRYVANWDI